MIWSYTVDIVHDVGRRAVRRVDAWCRYPFFSLRFFNGVRAIGIIGVLVLPNISSAAGDAKQGAHKNAMCIGCHGIAGYRTAYPAVYGVPLIHGQHAVYIVSALKAYKEGVRAHPSMRAIAASLSDQDMEDLAAFYSEAQRPSVR